jgi:hypothetical protein
VKPPVLSGNGAAANRYLREAAPHGFAANGLAFLDRYKAHGLFARTTHLPFYPAARESWENACVQYLARPFEGRITKDSTAREFLTELCLWQFAAGEVDEAIAEFDPDIPRAELIRFLQQESAAYRRRAGRPHNARSLTAVLLSMWLHGFLWLLSNEDRARMIEHVIGFDFDSCPGSEAEAVKVTIKRLGLIGWSAFTTGVPRPPMRFILRANRRHILRCHFALPEK